MAKLAWLWRVLVRAVIGALFILLAAAAYLIIFPDALEQVVDRLPIPGNAPIPTAGATPPAPVIEVPRGALPAGYRAFAGMSTQGAFSCGFLMRLENGQTAAFNAAHSVGVLPPDSAAELRTPRGALAARLTGQVAHGQTFVRDQFVTDYVVWGVEKSPDPERFILRPDTRGQGRPGERVIVYSPEEDGSDGPKTYGGVVVSILPSATWVQMDDSFSPRGFSGCPVISQVTGRVIGMAVAGKNLPPAMIGLHPVGSLVEKAEKAFAMIR